jgi:hypothetical protein
MEYDNISHVFMGRPGIKGLFILWVEIITLPGSLLWDTVEK